MGLIVADGGAGCTALDTAVPYANFASGTTYTTNSFNTSAASGKGLIFVGASSYYGSPSGGWTAGSIGGTSATIPSGGMLNGIVVGGGTSGAIESVAGKGTQTGITGTISNVTESYGPVMALAFK
jgi:hypothetical protein